MGNRRQACPQDDHHCGQWAADTTGASAIFRIDLFGRSRLPVGALPSRRLRSSIIFPALAKEDRSRFLTRRRDFVNEDIIPKHTYNQHCGSFSCYSQILHSVSCYVDLAIESKVLDCSRPSLISACCYLIPHNENIHGCLMRSLY